MGLFALAPHTSTQWGHVFNKGLRDFKVTKHKVGYSGGMTFKQRFTLVSVPKPKRGQTYTYNSLIGFRRRKHVVQETPCKLRQFFTNKHVWQSLLRKNIYYRYYIYFNYLPFIFVVISGLDSEELLELKCSSELSLFI
jgi:hypothetical protein